MMPATIIRTIHWLSSEPTPYNDYLFQQLARDSTIDLNVHYKRGNRSSHPWKSPLRQGYQSRFYKLLFGIDWCLLSQIYRDRNAFFVVAGWDHLTCQILLSLLRLCERPYALWSDTPNLKRKRSTAKARLRLIWLRWIFAGASRVMGTGDPGVQALREMGAPEDRLLNFPFWLDLNSFQPFSQSHQYITDRPVVLISSGKIINERKGHDIAIQALAKVAEKICVPFQYYIAGVGPDEHVLQALIDMNGLTDMVTLIGWVEPDELRTHYQNADVMLHPSPVHDPFPNAVLEGMAAGLVVFGSNESGSVMDRIEHGVNGFIHSAGDIDELAGQISYLFQHLERIPELARQARLTAEQWPVEKGVKLVKSVVEAS